MISVIVPIYKVEPYLEDCVNSIRQQTYQDLEIILVDDGSPDGCPALCNQFAKEDSRIRVIHKENGGLSDARNAGIDAAKGEFITFVDSDDYMHSLTYEKMIKILEEHEEVDMAVWQFQEVPANEKYKTEDEPLNWNGYVILDHSQVLADMRTEQRAAYIVAWNKLYRRELWKDLRFPKGKIHEDQFTSYKPLCQARKVAYTDYPFYYYRQREGSIMTTFSTKECMDDIEALQEKIAYFREYEKDYFADWACECLDQMFYHYGRSKKAGATATAKEIKQIAKNIYKDLPKKVIASFPKERRAYFQSCFVGDAYMQCYMGLYWKLMAGQRKVSRKIEKKKLYQLGKKHATDGNNPKISSIEETLEYIREQKLSVSRFGDGEFKWMAGIQQNSFQVASEAMTRRLKEIIKSEEEGHIVCLSDGFDTLDNLKEDARNFWFTFMGKYRQEWISYLKPNKQYYNTNMTRPYMDYADQTPCAHRFDLLKAIWEDRDLILIEGEKSRLGVGNDLFQGAKSIKRILAPAKNAYQKYDEILERACKYDKDALYLIALGPTATILAYDLHQTGRQAIDVGHVDIEYEWFLRKAEKKITIENKYVNEVDAGRYCVEMKDPAYQSQIVEKILW